MKVKIFDCESEKDLEQIEKRASFSVARIDEIEKERQRYLPQCRVEPKNDFGLFTNENFNQWLKECFVKISIIKGTPSSVIQVVWICTFF